jgi:predicted GNAT family acetyltransferase
MRSDDARDVLDEAGPFLAEDPVARNLAASLLTAAVQHGSPVHSWIGRHDDRVQSLLIRTDVHRFGLVFASSPMVAHALGESIGRDDGHLPSVRGEVGVVAAFAGAYATVTGRPAEAADAHRLYVLDDLQVPDVPGDVRRGADGDEALVVRWTEGFVTDTGFGSPDEVAMMVARLRSGLIRIWVDGDRPVAMGVGMPVVLGVCRVGWIYTPPEHRGVGYGAAVTAAISAEQLAGEASTCMLYTQLSNPVSNRIYQRLGYRPVREDLAYRFGQISVSDRATGIAGRLP